MYEQVNPRQEMATYATQVVETLFRNMAYEIRRTLDKPDEEGIHDLRVNSLRLRHAVRLFRKLFPARRGRKIRSRLGDLQEMLAEVRNCDIALQVLNLETIGEAVAQRTRRRLIGELGLERRRTMRPLRARLRKMQRADALQRWRTRLLGSA